MLSLPAHQAEVVRAEPIKLLEVNENTVAAGVMPLYFGPAPASGIPYPSVIVEVTGEHSVMVPGPDGHMTASARDLSVGDRVSSERSRNTSPTRPD